MTATDELRRLLDGWGVEWMGTDFTAPSKGHPTNTSLGEEYHDAAFIEYEDGSVLRLFDLTPEQAVEATLGRGECHVESIWDMTDQYEYAPHAYWQVNLSCGHSFEQGDPEPPNYCPNCGRKVVD